MGMMKRSCRGCGVYLGIGPGTDVCRLHADLPPDLATDEDVIAELLKMKRRVHVSHNEAIDTTIRILQESCT